MKSPGRNMINGSIVEYASHLKNGVQEVHAALYVLHFSLQSNVIDNLERMFTVAASDCYLLD